MPKFWKIHRLPLVVLFLTWGLYFFILFSHLIEWGPDGLYGNSIHIWSDWPFHIGMTHLFAFKPVSTWFAYHPMYAAGKFSYPFLTNLISGLLMRLGFGLVASLLIPSIIYSEFLCFGLYLVGYKLLKSTWQSLAALSIFFCSSGLGALRLWPNLAANFSFQSFFLPKEDPTSFPDHQWYSGNVVEGLLTTQRGYLLGMLLGIWALYFFLSAFEDGKRAPKNFLIASLFVGILPIAHMHTLLALFLGFLFVLISKPKFWRASFWLLIPSAILVFSFYFMFIYGGIEKNDFSRWFPLWGAHSVLEWLKLWTLYWGLTLPLVVVSLWKLRRKLEFRSLFLLGLSFFILFGIANFVLFQPVQWDNSKLFFWCYYFFCLLMVWYLTPWFLSKNRFQQIAGGIISLSLVFSGFINLHRTLHPEIQHYRLASISEIQFGEEIRDHTDPLARFLTSFSHNHLIMAWAARPIMLGFTPWVDNFGFVFQEAEKDFRRIFEARTDISSLLAKYQIRYVFVGAAERNDLHANENFFRCHYALVFQSSEFQVFDVSAAHSDLSSDCLSSPGPDNQDRQP